MSSNTGLEKIEVASMACRTIMPGVIIAAWIGFYYVSVFVFSKVSFSVDNLDFFISGLICSLSVFGVLAFLLEKKLQRQGALIILIFCIGADIFINKVLQNPRIVNGNNLLHFYAGINLSLLGIALCGGVLLGGIIKKPSYLIPLAAAAGLADIWSVTFGVTNEIVKSRTAMNFFLFSFPVAGKGIHPVIGVTDFIFAAMFLSLSSRFDMPVVRTQILVAASFIVSIVVGFLGGFGVPVLPVMGMFFIVGQYSNVKIVNPKEKREAIWGVFIIAAALTVVTLVKYFR